MIWLRTTAHKYCISWYKNKYNMLILSHTIYRTTNSIIILIFHLRSTVIMIEMGIIGMDILGFVSKSVLLSLSVKAKFKVSGKMIVILLTIKTKIIMISK